MSFVVYKRIRSEGLLIRISDEARNPVKTFDISEERQMNNGCCTKPIKIIAGIVICIILLGGIVGIVVFVKQTEVQKQTTANPGNKTMHEHQLNPQGS